MRKNSLCSSRQQEVIHALCLHFQFFSPKGPSCQGGRSESKIITDSTIITVAQPFQKTAREWATLTKRLKKSLKKKKCAWGGFCGYFFWQENPTGFNDPLKDHQGCDWVNISSNTADKSLGSTHHDILSNHSSIHQHASVKRFIRLIFCFFWQITQGRKFPTRMECYNPSRHTGSGRFFLFYTGIFGHATGSSVKK